MTKKPEERMDGGELTLMLSRRLGKTIYVVGQHGHEVARFQYKADAKRFISKQSAALIKTEAVK